MIGGSLQSYHPVNLSLEAEHSYKFPDQKRKRKVQEIKKLIYKFDIKTHESGL
jgi:hypothetical protein